MVDLTSELEEAKVDRDSAQAEIEQLKASKNQQLLNTTGQDAANAGMEMPAQPHQPTIS